MDQSVYTIMSFVGLVALLLGVVFYFVVGGSFITDGRKQYLSSGESKGATNTFDSQSNLIIGSIIKAFVVMFYTVGMVVIVVALLLENIHQLGNR